MIFPKTYRRPSLQADDDIFTGGSLVFALACHKGDSSQAQTSQQSGAQTQGANVSGTGNKANTGTQTNNGLQAEGSDVNLGVKIGDKSTYANTTNNTTTDLGTVNAASQAVGAALASLSSALSNSSNALVTAANARSEASLQAVAAAPAVAPDNSTAAPSAISATVSNLPWGLIVGCTGGALALFLLLRKTK